jgi:hypothetical protein
MKRARLAFVVLAVGVAVAMAVVWLLPRRYQTREQLAGVVVFWHDDEAFVFVDRYAMARSTNALVARLPTSGSWISLAPILSGYRGLGPLSTAHRVAGGAIERYELPNAAVAPAWDLEDGRLVARSRYGPTGGRDFRWTGKAFEWLDLAEAFARPTPRPTPRTLEPDDQQAAPDSGFGLVEGEARERFVRAGWHFKRLTGFEGVQAPAQLPIELASQRCTLTLRAEKREDPLMPFAATVELAGARLAPSTQVLFSDAGWQEASRAEVERRTHPLQRGAWPSGAWLFLVLFVSLLLLLLKTGGLLGALVPFLGLKQRLLKSVGTTMSFPTAVPEQFPQLDRARLDAFSAELERLGFERLLDTAPVADTPAPTPSFCRIYAHRRHGCFAVLMQSFPALGAPIDLRCMLNAQLDDGWSLGASNGRPIAASHFVRRPRALGFTRPGEPVDALLARFLRFRDQVSADLGIRAQADTSLETYVRLTIASLAEIREVMQKRSLTLGLGRYYARLAGVGERSQLVWLGDYPKLAGQRKAAGLGPGFSGTAVLE